MTTIEKRAKDNEQNNLLRLSFADVYVYLDFLEIIAERYEALAEEYRQNMSQQKALREGKTGSWTMSPDELKLYDEGHALFTKLRLEIESFFLFSHTLLNKATNFPARYFGHASRRGLECGSHERFWNSIQKIKPFLPIQGELMNDAEWLTEKVVHYRDKLITHTFSNEHHKRMLIRGMMFSNDGGNHKISSSVLYPTGDNPEQADSESIEDLAPHIDQYVVRYIDFLILHSDKSELMSQ